MAELIMCYAARMPGEKFHFGVALDVPKYRKFIARDVAGWILRGAIVERMTLEKGNKSQGKYHAQHFKVLHKDMNKLEGRINARK
jgi:hypothetical protein